MRPPRWTAVVLLEQPNEHRTANGERRAGSWQATRAVRARLSSSDKRPSSRAVISAVTRLRLLMARPKMVLGCPCAVTALPVGPDGCLSLLQPHAGVRYRERGGSHQSVVQSLDTAYQAAQ